ncbi:MAG TPA: HNH endonuclease, partial [Longimicrobium sp.]
WTLDALWWRVSRRNGDSALSEEDFEEAVQTTEEIDAGTPLDTRREVAMRTEQRFIRQQMFGAEPQAKCAICGKAYPVEFLRAAHVKRRAECTSEEKRDFRQNVVPMCTFGCDELFERGWIIVERGQVTKGRVGVLSDSVAAYIRSVEGRECLPYYRGGGEYFDWHARAHVGSNV